MDAVTHFEIPVGNMKRAQDFYSSTFGWTIQDLPKFHYAMIGTRNTSETGIKQSGAIDGGMMLKSDLIKSIILTIEVSDIDQAIENISRNGGEIIRGKDHLEGLGIQVYFKDTEDNIIGLWQDTSSK